MTTEKALQSLVNQVVTMDGKVTAPHLKAWADMASKVIGNQDIQISDYLRYLATMIEEDK